MNRIYAIHVVFQGPEVKIVFDRSKTIKRSLKPRQAGDPWVRHLAVLCNAAVWGGRGKVAGFPDGWAFYRR